MSLSKLIGFTYSKSLIYFLLFTVTFSIFSFSQQSFVLGGRFRPRFSLEFIDFRDQGMRLAKEVHLWSVLQGAFGIAHNSFGGTLETRIWVYTLGVMVSFALLKSWVAIRQKRIAEHRVWAIRTWGWTGCVSQDYYSLLSALVLNYGRKFNRAHVFYQSYIIVRN
ncbi:putative microtubule associated protein [Botrytis fragariae]|uniref:Putative microtubule associated protein n=1 Tax=Botrytis fragariae TaxID=1964551 RepID=A0A8H6AGX7_9HELO|nr:putative microtubule associated protein [Botrytis fragariae]KAF5867637.1 putative microtubule associated protein [Botrytis fragariae]